MAETLFDRRYRLTLAHPLVGDFARAAPNAIVIEKLRITFKITKTSTKEPNTAEIEVTNLSESQRALLQVKGMRVILEGGYADHVSGLFFGDARSIESFRKGPDWTTRIRCGDGERALGAARMNTSFGPGVPFADVIAKGAKAVGVDFNPADVAGKQFVNGYAAHGRASDVLDKVFQAAGLEWSIQEGKLQVLKPGSPNAEPAVDLSAETGLVGSPEFGTPDAKTKRSLLKVRALLAGRIRPGGRIVLSSLQHKGTFKVVKVEHTGDSSGADWYTDAEVAAL